MRVKVTRKRRWVLSDVKYARERRDEEEEDVNKECLASERDGAAAFVSVSPLWPGRRDLWLDAITRAFFSHASSGPWNKCMHYWSERRLNKATLHDVLTRCCSRGSATEYKSNIPNQITPSISMFYYLFSHKHARETRLRMCAERRPEGCWHDGKPTDSLLWDWPLTLTVKNFILCSNSM